MANHRVGDTVQDLVTKNFCLVTEIDQADARLRLHQLVMGSHYWREMHDVSEPMLKNGHPVPVRLDVPLKRRPMKAESDD